MTENCSWAIRSRVNKRERDNVNFLETRSRLKTNQFMIPITHTVFTQKNCKMKT